MPPIGRKTKLGLSVGQIPGVTGVSRSEDDTVVGDDMSAVLEQRETLIRERQAELGGLYDRHDDLVRLHNRIDRHFLTHFGSDSRSVPYGALRDLALLQPSSKSFIFLQQCYIFNSFLQEAKRDQTNVFREVSSLDVT